MQKSNKKKIEEFIRVDHAGERGAIKIYEGQLLALNTIVKNEELKKTIEHMKEHEVEHCEFFEKEIKKRGIEPTKFLPLWDLLGLGLGFGSTLLGKKAAMLCLITLPLVGHSSSHLLPESLCHWCPLLEAFDQRSTDSQEVQCTLMSLSQIIDCLNHN